MTLPREFSGARGIFFQVMKLRNNARLGANDGEK